MSARISTTGCCRPRDMPRGLCVDCFREIKRGLRCATCAVRPGQDRWTSHPKIGAGLSLRQLHPGGRVGLAFRGTIPAIFHWLATRRQGAQRSAKYWIEADGAPAYVLRVPRVPAHPLSRETGGP